MRSLAVLRPSAALLSAVLSVAVLGAQAPGHGLPQQPVTAPVPQDPSGLRLLDVHLVLLAAVGGSTASDAQLADLQAGAHDPAQRGFTLQEAELGVVGSVDEWLTGRLYLIAAIEPGSGETVLELEEAYLSAQVPEVPVQFDVGTFFTDFGRINRLHPHQWTWLDQPVMHSRVFGGDGLRGPGARATWRPGGPFHASFGVQNAAGETMVSFLANDEVYEERGIGGRAFTEREVRSPGDLLYAARACGAWEFGGHVRAELGASLLAGPNATGGSADTMIAGIDLLLAGGGGEHDHGSHAAAHDVRGWQLQAEFLARAFDAAEQVDDRVPSSPVVLPARTLDDYGGYVQFVTELGRSWSGGLRVDWASGSGASYDAANTSFARAGDAFRCDRLRCSPVLAFAASPRSRIRLQYNYDDSDHLPGGEHSVWLGFELRLGADAHAH